MAKNPAAVALGSRGGKARAKNLSQERRQEIARLAAEARWAKMKALGDQITRDNKKLLKEVERNAKRRKRRHGNP